MKIVKKSLSLHRIKYINRKYNRALIFIRKWENSMYDLIKYVKKDGSGYIVIVSAVLMIALTHLMSLCVYFLFLYLLTDLFTKDLQRRVPMIPSAVLFWLLFVIELGLFTLALLTIVPLVMKDFPSYFALVRDNSIGFIHVMSVKFGFAVDEQAIKAFIVSQSAKSFSIAVKVLNGISKELALLLFAFILNLLLFLENGAVAKIFAGKDKTMLIYLYDFCALRVKRFYGYFRKVMVGQFFISLINTTITFILIMLIGLPHKITLVCIVFLCGLLPVIGNLISNTILSLTALISIGIPAFLMCLALLVGVHKLEYFLNGKIIGTIISLPMFVTVLSLLLGEALLGVFGMIIAIPLVLSIRDELDSIKVDTAALKTDKT
jgi:predicted PurR-regulated permease PerM